MRRVCQAIAVLTMLLPDRARAQSPKLEIIDSRPFPEIAAIEDPLDAIPTPDGGLLIADYGSNSLIQLDSLGNIVRRIGRSGDGPGEFRALYRIAMTRGGKLLAFDQGTKEVSLFDSSGHFVRRTRLPYYFNQVDHILAASEDTLIVIGVSSYPQFQGRDFAIHYFNANLEHIKSIGPLAPVQNEGTRRLWGTGGGSMDADGNLTYVLRQPYVILRYDRTGRQIDSARVAMDLGPGPDQLLTITPGGRGAEYHINRNVDVVRVTGGFWLGGGLFLTGRSSNTERTIDLVDRSGSLVASTQLPPNIHGCPTYAVATQTLWCFGELGDEPRVFRLKLRISRP